MDFADIIPRDLHPFLLWLGKFEDKWLGITTGGEKRTEFHIDFPLLESDPEYPLHKRMMKLTAKDLMVAATHDALSSSICKGPKIFMPTAEQYDSMQQVDIHVPIADYRQPYPSMIVKIPAESRRALAIELGLNYQDCPLYTIIRTRKTVDGKVYVFILITFQNSGNDIVYVFQDREDFTDIESVLRHWVMDSKSITAEHAFSMANAHAILNLMLLLTNYGCKDAGPLNPKEWAKHHSHPKFKHFAVADFRSIEMTQSIIVRKTIIRDSDHESVPTGKEMRPHWCRGHWRSQHWGAGNLFTKQVFIPPVLRRKDRIVGDLSESQAVYTGPIVREKV